MISISRPLLPHLLLIITTSVLVHCQNFSVCNYTDNKCTQDQDIASELQSRALPQFSQYVSCLLKFENEEECTAPCFLEEDVFSIGEADVGQCYPIITMGLLLLDLAFEEAADCFQNGTIWKKMVPCGYDFREECESFSECEWYGGICGAKNSTLTDLERLDMLEAFEALNELRANGDDSTIINQVRQSIVPNPSYFCDIVIPEILLCYIQQKPLDSECGEVSSWYWESENDRQLFQDLQQCSDPLKQSSDSVCEVAF